MACHNRQELTLGAALQKQISHSSPSICRSRVIIVVCCKFSISLPEFSLQKFLSREIKQCFKRCDKAAGLIPRPDSTLNGEQIYYRSGFPLKAGEMFSSDPFHSFLTVPDCLFRTTALSFPVKTSMVLEYG